MKLGIYGLPEDDRAARAADLRRIGFDTLVVGMDREAAAAGRAAGLTAFVCTGTFTADPVKDAGLLAVDVDGIRRPWFGSGCPNRRELRARHFDRVREALAWPEVDGFYLDGIRFASPAAGLEAFTTCFCEACSACAGRLGLDFERMRAHVVQFRDRYLLNLDGFATLARPTGLAGAMADLPGVADWLGFRALCITEYVGEIAALVRGLPGRKRLGAYLFTPAFAPLVGQSYAKLGTHLDSISPMIYRLGGGDSVLSTETAAMASWPSVATAGERSRAVRATLALCGLGQASATWTPGGLRRGFAPAVAGHQAALAAEVLGASDKLAPIVTLQDRRLRETVATVRRSGASGISFFSYRAGGEEFLLKAAAAY